MKKLIVFLFITMLLASCSTVHRTKQSTTKKETIVTEDALGDSIRICQNPTFAQIDTLIALNTSPYHPIISIQSPPRIYFIKGYKECL